MAMSATEPGRDAAAGARASARRTAAVLGAIAFGIYALFILSGVIGR